MSRISEKILNYISLHQTRFLVVFLLLVFGAVAYYVYKNSGMLGDKYKAKFKDVANANQNVDKIDIYYFYAEWCPHCKNARPEWEKFKGTYHGKLLKNGNVKINCKDMDCSDGSTADAYKEEYDVSSYPTIKCYIDGDMNEQIDYDAKISYGLLETFVKELTGEQ
jgi:thiol-disulfide isomerase/thioredoxin